MPIVKKIGEYKKEDIVPKKIVASKEQAILALDMYRLEALQVEGRSTENQRFYWDSEYIRKYGDTDWHKMAEVIMDQVKENIHTLSKSDYRNILYYPSGTIYEFYLVDRSERSEIRNDEPSQQNHKEFGTVWVYKGSIYKIDGKYTNEQSRLLILEEEDQEQRLFKRLNLKFNSPYSGEDTLNSRLRIPENVRVEVWRRDGGKCARCGSRDKLEYDHIVPASMGGSNSARNIELLCEKCRSKHDNVV